MLFNNQIMLRQFAALNENYKKINLSEVQSSDVSESSVKGVGSLMAAMAKKGAKVNNEEEVCDQVEEFFRKNFRKIEFSDAKAIILGLGFNPDGKAEEKDTEMI